MTPLSRKGTLAYSTALLAAGIYYAFNNFTLALYLSLYTSNAILIGWLSSTRSFEQSIVQPVVGAWSDRTWTRVGRRAPFFLSAMPLAAVLLFINGLLPHDPAILWLVVAVVFAFWFLFNVGIDPYFALLADATTPRAARHGQRDRAGLWVCRAGGAARGGGFSVKRPPRLGLYRGRGQSAARLWNRGTGRARAEAPGR